MKKISILFLTLCGFFTLILVFGAANLEDDDDLLNWFLPILEQITFRGNGLKGYYFSETIRWNTDINKCKGRSLEDVRIVPQINFHWDTSPYTRFGYYNGNRQFSIQWTGEIKAPYSGAYTFHIHCDDEASLWLGNFNNNNPIIKTFHYGNYSSIDYILKKYKKYKIDLILTDHEGDTDIVLEWERPDGYGGRIREIIPKKYLYSEQLTELSARRESLLYNRMGFGANATGGTELITVSTMDEFINAVESNKPYWIKFQDRMRATFKVSRTIEVKSNKTIDGRGAFITFKQGHSKCDPNDDNGGNIFYVDNSSNIIFENIKFAGGSDCADRTECIKIQNWSDKIWIDHCHFEVSDEYGDSPSISIIQDRNKKNKIKYTGYHPMNITISFCEFRDQYKCIGIRSYNPDIDDIGEIPNEVKVTIFKNWFRHNKQRHPRFSSCYVHAVNNYYDLWHDNCINCVTNEGKEPGRLFIDHNIFYAKTCTSYPLVWDDCDVARIAASYWEGAGTPPGSGSDAQDGYIREYMNEPDNGAKIYENEPDKVPLPPYNYEYLLEINNENHLKWSLCRDIGAGIRY